MNPARGAVALFALLALPALAGGAKVQVGADADLSGYRTYAWERGPAADDDRVQRMINDSVERQLKTAGLERVAEGGDLLVANVAISESKTGSIVDPGYWGGGADFGVPTVSIADARKETLMVRIKSGETEEVLWQATGAAKNIAGQGKDVHKRIDSIVHKIFKKFPR